MVTTQKEFIDMVEAIEKPGGIDAVRALLKAGYVVDYASHAEKSNALHAAARLGRTTICKLLLAAGADINAKTVGGVTPLHFAIANRKSKVAKLLIARGVDIDSVNSAGETPLRYAAADGYLEMVKELMVAGANASLMPEQPREYYVTPFESTVYLNPNEGDKHPELLVDKMAVVTFLVLECGQNPDPDRVCHEGRTLHGLANGDPRMEALLRSLKTEISVRAVFADGEPSKSRKTGGPSPL